MPYQKEAVSRSALYSDRLKGYTEIYVDQEKQIVQHIEDHMPEKPVSGAGGGAAKGALNRSTRYNDKSTRQTTT